MDEFEFQQENPDISSDDIRVYFQRKHQVKELLIVYVTQTSRRLNFTSILPATYTEFSYFAKSPEQRFADRVERATRHMASHNGVDEIHANHSSLNSQDLVTYFWIEIAAIYEVANKQLFPSRQYTRDIITSGRYVSILNSFRPTLLHSREKFDNATGGTYSQIAACMSFQPY